MWQIKNQEQCHKFQKLKQQNRHAIEFLTLDHFLYKRYFKQKISKVSF
jgi:hypothetical protein